MKKYVSSECVRRGKKKLIADKTREPGKCWKVSGTLFEVRAAEAAARHLRDINTCRGQPVFFGGGIWEYVSLKKHSCVYRRSRVHTRVCAGVRARWPAHSPTRPPARAHSLTHTHTHTHTHTYSQSSWGVNFTPRPCEC